MMPDQINEPKKSSHTLLISTCVVVVLVIATYIVFHYVKKTNTSTVIDIPQTVDTTQTTASSTATSQNTYTDGTYTAVGMYNSPGGAEQITISLTLKDDVVVDTTAHVDATRPESKKYQNMFVQNYKSSVVGKNISTLNLSKVSGSSLTPKGFNDAVAKIQAQAKA